MSDEFSGYVAPGFEPVADAFRATFEAGEELGARFCAIQEGEALVDIWAGWADRDRSARWTDDTLACLFSSGKAAMATVVAAAVGEGALDYDQPIANWWPEFAAAGKGGVTLAMALSHQAGLCGFPDEMAPEDWIDWEKICARLAAMAPLWPPGSAAGYHPQTVGFIVGETYRRATGRMLGAALRDLGRNIHCGLAPDEMARVAYMQKPPSAPIHRKNSPLTEIAFLKPWSAAAKVAREDWLAAEIPASNMHATARGLAEIIHPLANRGFGVAGRRVIAEGAVRSALHIRMTGEDLVLPFNVAWSAGLMANTNGHFGPHAAAFGHAGFGGSCAMVDPSRRVSAAYVMNKMSPSLAGDPRAVRLLAALDACL